MAVTRRRPDPNLRLIRVRTPSRFSLAARIEWHRRALATLEAQQRDEDDARFLRVLLIGTKGESFNLAILRLRAALDADLREALGAQRPRQIGQRLFRLTDRVLDGLCLLRINRDELGCNWQVVIT